MHSALMLNRDWSSGDHPPAAIQHAYAHITAAQRHNTQGTQGGGLDLDGVVISATATGTLAP